MASRTIQTLPSPISLNCMKKPIQNILILISLSIVAPLNLNAQYFAGAELTYTALGGFDYLIEYTMYRDCYGIAAFDSVILNLSSASNPSFNTNLTLFPVSGTGQQISNSCSASNTTCNGGTLWGIQKHVYQCQATIPPSTDWVLSYSHCCRSPANTVANPTSSFYFIPALMNNINIQSNSSPRFTIDPLFVICSGVTVTINYGAVDPDGDSLSYSLVSPKTTGMNSSMMWLGGYSAQQFFSSLPPISLDPVTGDLHMSPIMNITTPMVLRVDSWRKVNNSMVNNGTIFRDINIRVMSCIDQLPVLSGIDNSLSHIYDPNDTIYHKELCVGSTLDFTIKGFDADTFNPLALGSPHLFEISWNHGIPAGNFSTYYNGTDSAYARFTWTPTAAQISNTPHCFTAKIRDDACPYYGQQSYSYCFLVNGSLNIGDDTLLCKGESVTINAVADSSMANFVWQMNGLSLGLPLNTMTHTIQTASLTPGTYNLSVQSSTGSMPGAKTCTMDINIEVTFQPDVNLGDDTIACQGDILTLDAGPGTLYTWNTGASTQSILVNQAAYYWVEVDGGHGTRCTDNDTIYVGFDTCNSILEICSVLAKAFPNPFGQSLYLQLDPAFLGPINVEMFDSEGQLIHTEHMVVTANIILQLSPPTSIPNGIYILKIINHYGQQEVMKVVKKE
jgi:hypothetical protein